MPPPSVDWALQSAVQIPSTAGGTHPLKHADVIRIAHLTLLTTSIGLSWDRKRVSGIAGTASFIVWLFAQSPQLYKNYQRKSVSGLSLVFLTQWIVADALNLVGALLTRQLPFQIAVALYFCCVDSVIVFQWIRYSQINPPPRLPKARYERHRVHRPLHHHHYSNTLPASPQQKYRPSMSQSLTLTRPSQSLLISGGSGNGVGYASMASTTPLDQIALGGGQPSRRAHSHPARPLGRTSSDVGQRDGPSLTPIASNIREGEAASHVHGSRVAQTQEDEQKSARADSRSKASLQMTPGSRSATSSRTSSPTCSFQPSPRPHTDDKASVPPSPVRGRPTTTTPRGAFTPQQQQHQALHSIFDARPSNSRSPSSSSSYRLMTQEAIRVALLAERLEERRSRRSRSRSSPAIADEDGYFVGRYDHLGLRIVSSQEGSTGSSRRASIDEEGQQDRRYSKGKSREASLAVRTDEDEGGESSITITRGGEATARPSPEGSVPPAMRRSSRQSSSAATAAQSVDPLIPLSTKSRHPRRSARSRMRSSTADLDSRIGRSRSRKRKATSAVAGLFSLLGIGSLVGLGEVGASVGFWSMPTYEPSSASTPSYLSDVKRETGWRHPIMLYPLARSWETSAADCFKSGVTSVVCLAEVDHRRNQDDHRHHRHNPPSIPPPQQPSSGDDGPSSPTDPHLPPHPRTTNLPLLIGRIASWICTILYTTSRLPQLYLNARRRSVEGLSILLFVSAFMGNFLYSLSILASPEAVGEGGREYLRESMPFLLGSGGTLVFDAVIVLQWWMWGRKAGGARVDGGA